MATITKSNYGVSLRNIIHPTDFSHGSDVAFAHALRMTLAAHGDLEVLHIDRDRGKTEWNKYPAVRAVLENWGILPQNSHRRDVARLGVNISKSACTETDAASGVLQHISSRGADLIVMATHQREGLDRWMHGSLAEYVSCRTDASTLFVPYGTDGFVNLQTGVVSLKRILIPIDTTPDAQVAVDAVAEMVRLLADSPVEVDLLHVGDPASMPGVTLPTVEECNWRWETRVGSVVDAICDHAQEQKSDLVVMVTNGHDGFLDAVRGSTSERVLHQLQCPLLSVHNWE